MGNIIEDNVNMDININKYTIFLFIHQLLITFLF
jgi:hypothetical protein